MPGTPAPRHLRFMPHGTGPGQPKARISITLDLQGDGESITGLLITGEAVRPFSGWIGLFGELDRLLAGSPAAADCEGDEA